MPSALDVSFDRAMAETIAPGSPLASAPDATGRVIATNLPATLPAFFDMVAAQHGDGTAVVAGDERLSYNDLKQHSIALAKALAGAGITKGDRVAIAMRNCPAWLVAFMGVTRAGGIATLINGWWQPDELTHGLNLTDPVMVIADPERARRIEATGHAARIVTLDIELPIARALAPLIGGVTPGELPEITAGEDATILFTSGSTGLSKGAVSTHRAVTMGIYTYLAYSAALVHLLLGEGCTMKDPPAALVAVPMFHVTGEVPVVLNSLAIGRKLVLMRKWDAGEALRLIEAERITYFVGVPTMSLELIQHPDRAMRDTSSLLDIVAGGAPRPVAHVPRLVEAFPDANPMMGYGLTETNAVGCTNFRGNYIAKPASTGRPHTPFVDIAILGPDDAHLPPNETGEIAIRAAANIRGYWRDEKATAAAFTADGFFKTGDIGYRDEDGYIFIVDRKKDIIIRGGENISCQEVEAAIYAHPAVAEASVFGLADDRLGEVPAAVVHLEPGAHVDACGLRDFLDQRLARFKLPSRMWFSDDPLPKLGTGKIDKVMLRKQYAAALEIAG